MSEQKYIATVEEDAWGELVLVFPDGCLPEDWVEGTTVEWIDQKDGSWLLRKKEMTSKYVMVECISTFRQRYVVEVPADAKCGPIEYAEDTVALEEYKEFSQKHIGETIVSSREVTREEILKICDIDNDYCKSWTDEQKMDVFVTPPDYVNENK